MHKLKKLVLSFLIVILIIFQYLNPIEAVSDLEITSDVTISGTSIHYDKIIIHNGGKLIIDSSQITINVNYLQIDAGGEVTYHSN